VRVLLLCKLFFFIGWALGCFLITKTRRASSLVRYVFCNDLLFFYFFCLNVIVWRVLFSLCLYVFLALVRVCSVFCILTTLTYFTIRIQICVRCYSSGLILICQFFVLHVLYVFCVLWVVTLCSQLLCLCLRVCCVRVVALVCLCRLQSYVFCLSYLFVFSDSLLFYFVWLVCLLLHMFILFICLFLSSPLYEHMSCPLFCLYVYVSLCLCCIFFYKLCCVFVCAARRARTLCQKPYGVCRSRLKDAERPPKLMHLPSVCLKAVELWF